MISLQDFIINESGWAYDKCNGFAILKPEFLDHEDEWIHMLTDQGWAIENHLKFQMSKDQAKDLYKCHCDEPWFNDLCDYMSSGPCICALCYKKTDSPIKDMKDIKHDFRDKYGKDEMRNGMHSSDTLKNVQREGKITLY